MTPTQYLHSKMSKKELLADKYLQWAKTMKRLAAKAKSEERSAMLLRLSNAAIEKAQLILN